MKRYFLIIFLVFVVLNAFYKSYIYFSSEKTEGHVVEFEDYTTRHRTRNGGVSYETSIAPTIVYDYNGNACKQSKSKWGYINLLKIDDKVTVLISGKEKKVEINTFFQFWFTFYDMIAAFSLCVVGTIILANVLPEKEAGIKTWK